MGKKSNIVVVGGSFNPPTIAHMGIMENALEAVAGELGYFVPVSQAYLKRKMDASGERGLILPDELRLGMLEAMIAGEPRIRIDTLEMGVPFAYTRDTMEALQARHPEARLYFVLGADHLPLLERFVGWWDFLSRFGAVVVPRRGRGFQDAHGRMERIRAGERIAEESAEASAEAASSRASVIGEIEKRETLNRWKESIVVLEALPEPLEISSTLVRGHLSDPEAAEGLLHPAAAGMLRSYLEEKEKEKEGGPA